jgi:MazG nucleotide pyrophosphohydrolase domain
MDEIYGERDRERGLSATVAWLAEEVGELAQAVRRGDAARREHELGDVLAWLAHSRISWTHLLKTPVDVMSMGVRGVGACPVGALEGDRLVDC